MGRKRRRRDSDESSLSSDSSDSLFVSGDSDEEQKPKRKKRYSSDDEYDPNRDNVEQATSYRRSRRRNFSPTDPVLDPSNASSRNPVATNNPLACSVRQGAAIPQVPQPITHSMILTPAFNLSLTQLLSNPEQSTAFVQPDIQQPAASDSLTLVEYSNNVIDLDTDEVNNARVTGTNADAADWNSLFVPAPIALARKSDLEGKILSELEALVAPPVTLCMECETVCDELDDRCPDQGPMERLPCPEYEYGLRRTVFNNDLILTCETISEENDCSYSYPEELSGKQRDDYEAKIKAYTTYHQIYSNRQNKNYKMTAVDLGKTGETLMQFKDRLRQEMKAAAHSNANRVHSSTPSRQTAAKSTGSTMWTRKT